MNTLTMENLMERASRKTRLDDFGNENFQFPLGKLLDSFEKNHGSNTDKKFSFAYTLIDILSKRLYIQDNFKSYPEILNIPIDRPLFITGLPRTGTTLIHNLISQGPCWRVLPYWELLYPYFREELKSNYKEHFLRLTEQLLKGLYAKYPALIYRHETTAEGPEECVHLLRNTFYSNSFAAEWELYEYLEWYMEQDLSRSYRYYRKMLQLLLWREHRDHLLLKCPGHLPGVGAILKVFPDANIIWMHRNPCKSIASVLSLYSVFHEGETRFNDFIDLYLDYFKESLHKAINMVKSGNKQIKSISYKKLIKDQVGVCREIYGEFEYPWDSSTEQSIIKWLEKHPQHKHGVHQYSLEEFGLTDTDIQNRFSQYFAEYGHLL